jgi:hypothetical protein
MIVSRCEREGTRSAYQLGSRLVEGSTRGLRLRRRYHADLESACQNMAWPQAGIAWHQRSSFGSKEMMETW